MLLVAACGGKRSDSDTAETSIGTSTSIEGDSTLYGLACEGCSDSVVVLLPGDGSDPVTYDIIDAMKAGRVAGRLETGCWICLMLDPEDSTKVRSVINLDELKGTWVQMVRPTLRQRVVDVDADEQSRARRDSVINELLQPMEIGFAIKRHYTAEPVGMRRQDADNGPVVYPTPKIYTSWHVFNGRVVLIEGRAPVITVDSLVVSTDTTAVAETTLSNDTVEVLLLTRDSLSLRFNDGTVSGYRRKTSDSSENE